MRRQLGRRGDILGIGIERIDYTKGIPERFEAIRSILRALPGIPRAPHVRASWRADPRAHRFLPAD